MHDALIVSLRVAERLSIDDHSISPVTLPWTLRSINRVSARPVIYYYAIKHGCFQCSISSQVPSSNLDIKFSFFLAVQSSFIDNFSAKYFINFETAKWDTLFMLEHAEFKE